MEDLRCQETYHDSTVSPYQQNSLAYNQSLVCRAYKDPVILEDERVFQNMLDLEETYISVTNYFSNRQSEIKPHMRKIVTDWMLEVCIDQHCHADVFLLSCNIMDRFLSQLNIKKNQFQLVASATMFIASKLVDPHPISSSDLVLATDNTYQHTELLEMELLILSKLKWDLSAITPYDFLEHLLRLLTLCNDDLQLESELLRRKTENVIILCATEYRFSMYPPSMLSSAAIAAAAKGLSADEKFEHNLDISELIRRLQYLTRVENDCLNSCIRQIEETFREATNNVNNSRQPRENTQYTNSQSNNVNNSTKVKNNNQIDSKTTSSAKENTIYVSSDSNSSTSSVEELKSQTPTEVLNVDWMYVT